jgi:hypothetical protein
VEDAAFPVQVMISESRSIRGHALCSDHSVDRRREGGVHVIGGQRIREWDMSRDTTFRRTVETRMRTMRHYLMM